MQGDFLRYGYWDFYNGIPITSYLEPNPLFVHSKRAPFFNGDRDRDPFEVDLRHFDQRKKQRLGQRQGRVNQYEYVTSKKPKAVDEDLYKIPPELLYQIPRRKRMLGNLLAGCLGLSCIG